MSCKIPKSFLLILCFSLAGQLASGQVLNKPVAAANPNLSSTEPWSSVCASEQFNEYFVNFSWSPPLVDDNNEFVLELSDANGSFDRPVELSRVSDKNLVFNFDLPFSLPEQTQGDGYRFRVKSTLPPLISEVSDPYAMYYIESNTPILISQDGNGTIPPSSGLHICNGSSIALAIHNLPSPEIYTFNWYRSGTLLAETSSSINIDQAGIYFVEIDYGNACSGSANTLSNSIEVTVVPFQGLAIGTPSQTTLCPNDIITLTANISGMGYNYTWYKDGTIVSGPTVDASTYIVDGGLPGFEGDYSVEISGSTICLEESAPVALLSPQGFSVTRENPERMVLLPQQNQIVSIATDAVNPTVQWYKDGISIVGETGLTLNIQEIGEYYATVTGTGGPCSPMTKTSGATTVVSPSNFDVTIAYNGNYTDCTYGAIALGISQITATENGNSFDVTDQLINDFSYQWMKDGASIVEGTGPSITITSPNENGSYSLRGRLDGFSMTSNALDVLLNSMDPITISADGNQLCVGGTITITSSYDLNGGVFNWLRNGQSIDGSSPRFTVTEEGDYQLSVMTNGCTTLSNVITIERFDESVIGVNSEEHIVLAEGASQTVTATGGTSYEWYDPRNELISMTGSVILGEEGTYTLVITVDNCQVTRSFTLAYRDTFQIPNVITANGDGINDLWVLPNTYSGQSDITIIIYNELGQQLLNQTEYPNNWPPSSLGFTKKNQLFYYKIRKADQTIKQGTITVIK